MTSEAQRNKGWILPETIDPTEIICVKFMIPNDFYYRIAATGAITELSKWWNWEKDGTQRASQAARLMASVAVPSIVFDDCSVAIGGVLMSEIHHKRAFLGSDVDVSSSISGWQTVASVEVEINSPDLLLSAEFQYRYLSGGTNGNCNTRVEIVEPQWDAGSSETAQLDGTNTSRYNDTVKMDWHYTGEDAFPVTVTVALRANIAADTGTATFKYLSQRSINFQVIEYSPAIATAAEINEILPSTGTIITINNDIATNATNIESNTTNITTIQSDLTTVNAAIASLQAEQITQNAAIASIESDIEEITTKLAGLLNLGFYQHNDFGGGLTSIYDLNVGSYGTGVLLPELTLGEGVVDAYRAIFEPQDYNALWCAAISVTATDTPTFAAKAFLVGLNEPNNQQWQYVEMEEGRETILFLLRAYQRTNLDWQFVVRELNGSLDWQVNGVSWYYAIDPTIFD